MGLPGPTPAPRASASARHRGQPVVRLLAGVGDGALLFGEPFGPRTVLGLALGLVAVVVVHRGAAPRGDGRAGDPARDPATRGRTDAVSGAPR